MIRRVKTGAALIGLLSVGTLFSGCWDRREVEETAFASLLAIDNGEKGGVKITVQIPLPAKVGGGEGGGGGGEGPSFILRTLEGKTISEAITTINTFSDRRLNFTHTKMLIFSSDYIAKQGFGEALEFATRFREIRRTAWVAVTEGKAADIAKIQPEEEKNPSDYYTGLMNQARHTGITAATPIHDITIQASPKTPAGVVVPFITPTTGDQTQADQPAEAGDKAPPPKDVLVKGLAVVDKLKIQGKLNDSESMGYLFMRGRFIGGVIPVTVRDSRVTLAVREASRSVKLLSDKPPYKFLVSIDVDADITEVKGTTDLVTDKGIQLLDKTLAKEIKRRCLASVKKAKDEYGTDIFDLGRYVRASVRLDDWLKIDWPKEFHDSSITVETDAHIRRSGNAFQPLESISAE